MAAKREVTAVPEVLQENFVEAFGTERGKLQERLFHDLMNSLYWPPGLTAEEQMERAQGALALLQALKPEDGLEGILAVQMASVHSSAMHCLRLANDPNAVPLRDQYLKNAVKLLTLYGQQMAALDKRRGRGQQKVTVEYVNVEAGGQAIVGNVEAGAETKRKLPSPRRRRREITEIAADPKPTRPAGTETK